MKFKIVHIVLFSLCLTVSNNLFSTHLVGGFISYEYVGKGSFGTRYLITITSYRDCKPGSLEFSKDIDVCVYNQNGYRLYKTINFRRKKIEKVNPVGRTDCPEATQVCLEKAIFQELVDLETNPFGYIVKWEVCCRNEQVNLRNDQQGNPFIGQTYQTFIPNTNWVNSTPSFTEVPVPFICINDTTQLNNYAVDPDGDSLVYKLATPWYGTSLSNQFPGCSPIYSPPISISGNDYQPGYNGNMPFGANGIATINSSNGITTFLANQIGNYAVAIDLLEYRNGILLSSTRLDLQILVIKCTPNNKPSISTSSKNYTIMAGDNLCFDVNSNDKDNHNITLTGIGDILTGSNGFTGNRATFSSAYGKGNVTSRFCWQTSCNHSRNTPYTFTAKAIDDGCPSKFTLVDVNITVLPFTGKSTLTGPTSICQGAKDVIYTINSTANTPNELVGMTNKITVTGGTIVTQTSTQLIINWNKGISQGIISIIPVSRFNCEGIPYELIVIILPGAPTPVLNQVDTVCENSNESYNTVFTAGFTYSWWVENGSIFGSNNSNSVNIVWGVPGSASAKLVQYSQNGCPSDTATIKVWISKPKTPDIIGKKSICPNSKGLIYSVATTAYGSSFNWVVSGGTITGSSSGNSVIVNWGNEGIGFIKVIEINRFFCKGDTVSLPINKTYMLVADMIEGDTDICEFSNSQIYSVLFTPNTTYNWNVTGGTLTSGQGSNLITVDWGVSGTGSVSMYETSFDSINLKNCISNLTTRIVHVRPYPTANTINGIPEICQYSNAGKYVVNGFSNSKYLWSINGDTANIQGQTTSSMTLDYNKEGTFQIEVVETTEYGCEGPILKLIVVVHPKPRTTAITGDSIICFPNLTNFNYSTSGFSNSTYYWFVDGGVPINPSNSSSISINWIGQQINHVKVLEVSDFGCPGDTQILSIFYDNPSIYLNYITVNPPPKADDGMEVYWALNNGPRYNNQFIIEKRAAGSGQAFTTAGTVNGNQVKFNDINTLNDSNAWEYRIKGFDLCGQNLFTSIHTNILLKGNKTGGYEVSLGFTPYLGWGNGNVRYDMYRKLKNTTQYELYESNIMSFNAAYSNGLEYYTQCYRVMGTKLGTDTVTWSNEVCFNFDPVIFIPDAFSPNGDDVNDVFSIKGGALKTVNFYIYNRWGEKLFIGNNIQDAWDGTYKGNKQPQDVYMYYCFYTGFDGRRYSTKGTISLLR